MTSATAIGRLDTLSDPFYFQAQILQAGKKYFDAARDKAIELSNTIRSGFLNSTIIVDDIIPAFKAAASWLEEQMDRIAIKGKEGQALFDAEGMLDGAENTLRKDRKKRWRQESAVMALTGRYAPA